MTTFKSLFSFAAFLAVLAFASNASAYNYIYSCGARWQSTPVSYYVNNAGSADLPFNSVLSTFESSFASWEAPCCSSYRANYAGTTQSTAKNPGRNVVLSFDDTSWDPQYGQQNVTIGVTLVQALGDCTIYNAPILFNGVGFNFRTDGRSTDLESIATHEIGHHLGLGHETQFNGRLPTMYPSYDGSTGFRSLESDDINGLCSLYPGGSCNCSRDSDCVGDLVCIGGTCREPPCQSDADCSEGQVCGGDGECAPQTCTTDDNCDSGFACTGGICERCSVCDRCNSNNDCGANGICIGDLGGKCLSYCGPDGSCPGTTVCVDAGGAYVCVNPDYQAAGVCPENFSCATGTAVSECNFSADCPPGQACVEQDGLGSCEPSEDPCFRIFCEAGTVCVDGNCTDEGSTGNNNTGNNTTANNTTGNSNTGGTNNNTSGGNGGEEPVVITGTKPGSNTDDGCSAAGAGSMTPFGLLILAGWLIRRRRT